MKHVVKRSGQSQSYDERKLYASIYASCLSVHDTSASAELVAEKVTADIARWLTDKSEVTANDIRKIAGGSLTKLNPHAGYLYLHHRIMW